MYLYFIYRTYLNSNLSIMKCYRFLKTLQLSFLIILSSNLLATSISGPLEVCKGEYCKYTVSGGNGNSYIWTTTIGKIKVIDDYSVEIYFDVEGQASIKVRDLFAPIDSQFTEIKVNINSIAKPDILFAEKDNCKVEYYLIQNETVQKKQSICFGSQQLYLADNINKESLLWKVEGGTVINTEGKGVVVKWDKEGPGYIKLVVKNNSGCIDSIKYDFEILPDIKVDIEGSKGGFDFEEACIGQEIYLEAKSEEASDYVWDIQHKGFMKGKNIKIIFDKEGEYNIKLIAIKDILNENNPDNIFYENPDSLKTFVNCTCKDTTYYKIKVNPGSFPLLECTGTTCSGIEATYFAVTPCDTYKWSLSPNGQITKGGGTKDQFISVKWNNGGNGEITLEERGCLQNVCSEINTIEIPVIGEKVKIIGPQIVCNEEVTAYYIPGFQGTTYIWSVEKNGQIIEGQGTNEIKVKWKLQDLSNIQPSTIKVKFENCYLGCSDSTTLDVSVLEQLRILKFSNSYCKDNVGYFEYNHISNFYNTPLWTITSPTGIVETIIDNQLNYKFSENGTYKIRLDIEKGIRCNDSDEILVDIYPLPDPPKEIIGPLSICKNEYASYSIGALKPNEIVYWKINDGTGYSSQINLTGQSITYKWKSNGQYFIEAYTYNIITGCSSDVINLVLNKQPTITGSSTACLDEIEEYSIGVTKESGLKWNIVPSYAGTIISTDGGILKIQWHSSGFNIVEAFYCSGIYQLQVNVLPKVTLNPIIPAKVCSGELSEINIPLPSNSTITIMDKSGNIVTDKSISKLPKGDYVAEITDENGCKARESFNIEEFPEPKVTISTPDLEIFCQFKAPVKIIAENRADLFTNFNWFKDNLPLLETSPKLNTLDFGTYHLEIIDKNGCTANSNDLVIQQNCDTIIFGGGCTNPCEGGVCKIKDLNLSFDCNEKTFEMSSIGLYSTEFKWNFDDPDSGEDNISTSLNPTHVFTHAGYFHVSVNGNFIDESGFKAIEISVVPRFDYKINCFGEPVEFQNLSTFIPGFEGLIYAWDFGDPASGVNNISSKANPEHIFSGEGSFSVTLTVTDKNGCVSSFVKIVDIKKNPNIEILNFPINCKDKATSFSNISSIDVVNYKWSFGDPSSSDANISELKTPFHIYNNTGSYTILLETTDLYNCKTTTSKTIDIISNPFAGNINVDGNIPKCKGQSIKLIAPIGGDNYYWSNGSTSSSIDVLEHGVYSVTITSAGNCDYVPEAVQVFDYSSNDVIISGLTYENPISPTVHYDSLSICQGTIFDLSATYLNNVKYHWSNGITTYYNDFTNFSALTPGKYQYDVEVKDLSTGCTILSKPFLIIINPNPAVPVIDTDGGNLCEGSPHLLKVKNIEPDILYKWNNDEIGPQIITEISGDYQLVSTNKYGCQTESNKIVIYEKPNVNIWNSACKEVCFPEEVCLKIQNNDYIYKIAKDGEIIQTINNYSPEVIIDESGDYQLIVTNSQGCVDTSDYLSFSALPKDQSVSGIVYQDIDENRIYDAGEILLSGINIILMKGNNVIASCKTDNNGKYIFDPIDDSHLRIMIDTSDLDFVVSGRMDSLLVFSECIEDKYVDFPLIKKCNIPPKSIKYFVCHGDNIIIAGNEYQSGMSDTLFLKSVSNCDSLIMFEILSYPEIKVSIDATPSCSNDENGSISIVKLSGDNLKFALDSDPNFSDKNEFKGLPAGYHMLNIIDKNNCTENLPFEIEKLSQPNIEINTTTYCEALKNGSLTINTDEVGMQYSLDGLNYSSSSEFQNLQGGDYNLFVLTEHQCLYKFPFTINSITQPQQQLVTSPTCVGENDGTMRIIELAGNDALYSIDNIHFTDDTLYTGLKQGNYNLQVKISEFCTYDYPFIVQENPLPKVVVETENTCTDAGEGTIKIKSGKSGYLYCLENSTFGSDTIFSSLNSGRYQIKVKDSLNCEFITQVEIKNHPSLVVDFPTLNTDCSTKEVMISPNITSCYGDIGYRWNDGSQAKEKMINTSGNYSVTVSDLCSEISKAWNITVYNSDGDNTLYVPNIFTPDGDKQNDCMKVTIDSKIKLLGYNISIFDRWGEKMYQSDDYLGCWNGYFQGKPVAPGVYVYIINYIVEQCDVPKNFTIQGDVTIIR